MIGSSSTRIKERLTDGDVIVVEVFREPLLGQGLLGVIDISLRDEVVVGLIICGGVVSVRVTQLLSGSARGFSPRHKEEEGEKQKEVLEAKCDEEKENEMDGEVEEITHLAHET